MSEQVGEIYQYWTVRGTDVYRVGITEPAFMCVTDNDAISAAYSLDRRDAELTALRSSVQRLRARLSNRSSDYHSRAGHGGTYTDCQQNPCKGDRDALNPQAPAGGAG